MKREGPKSIAVLTGICLVVAVLLAAVNYVTAPIIAKSAQSGAEASLYVVLPNAAGFEEEAGAVTLLLSPPFLPILLLP